MKADDSELLAKMPDPPTTDPLEEGQPEAKKQKVATEQPEEDWEAIEKPESFATNGFDPDFDDDDEKILSAEEQAKADEIKEVREAALHVAEGGGDPPQNGLLRDW